MSNYWLHIYNIRRSVAAILLLIFSAYYANITLFSHKHVVDGAIIVHSHLYNKNHTSDQSDGSHSDAELNLISVISHFIAEAQESFALAELSIQNLFPHYAEVVVTLVIAPLCVLPLLRAPPAEIYIG